MSTPSLVYLLTALAGLVVISTRVRLARDEARGTFRMGHGLVNVHTVVGVLGLAIWLVFLVSDEETVAGGSVVGIVGLFFLWVTALLGLLILMRWLPTSGKHAGDRAAGSVLTGPVLSLFAHVGLLVCVCYFTYAYLTQKV